MIAKLDPKRRTCSPTDCGIRDVGQIDKPTELELCLRYRLRPILGGGEPSSGAIERARECAETVVQVDTGRFATEAFQLLSLTNSARSSRILGSSGEEGDRKLEALRKELHNILDSQWPERLAEFEDEALAGHREEAARIFRTRFSDAWNWRKKKGLGFEEFLEQDRKVAVACKKLYKIFLVSWMNKFHYEAIILQFTSKVKEVLRRAIEQLERWEIDDAIKLVKEAETLRTETDIELLTFKSSLDPEEVPVLKEIVAVRDQIEKASLGRQNLESLLNGVATPKNTSIWSPVPPESLQNDLIPPDGFIGWPFTEQQWNDWERSIQNAITDWWNVALNPLLPPNASGWLTDEESIRVLKLHETRNKARTYWDEIVRYRKCFRDVVDRLEKLRFPDKLASRLERVLWESKAEDLGRTGSSGFTRTRETLSFSQLSWERGDEIVKMMNELARLVEDLHKNPVLDLATRDPIGQYTYYKGKPLWEALSALVRKSGERHDQLELAETAKRGGNFEEAVEIYCRPIFEGVNNIEVLLNEARLSGLDREIEKLVARGKYDEALIRLHVANDSDYIERKKRLIDDRRRGSVAVKEFSDRVNALLIEMAKSGPNATRVQRSALNKVVESYHQVTPCRKMLLDTDLTQFDDTRLKLQGIIQTLFSEWREIERVIPASNGRLVWLSGGEIEELESDVDETILAVEQIPPEIGKDIVEETMMALKNQHIIVRLHRAILKEDYNSGNHLLEELPTDLRSHPALRSLATRLRIKSALSREDVEELLKLIKTWGCEKCQQEGVKIPQLALSLVRMNNQNGLNTLNTDCPGAPLLNACIEGLRMTQYGNPGIPAILRVVNEVKKVLRGNENEIRELVNILNGFLIKANHLAAAAKFWEELSTLELAVDSKDDPTGTLQKDVTSAVEAARAWLSQEPGERSFKVLSEEAKCFFEIIKRFAEEIELLNRLEVTIPDTIKQLDLRPEQIKLEAAENLFAEAARMSDSDAIGRNIDSLQGGGGTLRTLDKNIEDARVPAIQMGLRDTPLAQPAIDCLNKSHDVCRKIPTLEERLFKSLNDSDLREPDPRGFKGTRMSAAEIWTKIAEVGNDIQVKTVYLEKCLIPGLRRHRKLLRANNFNLASSVGEHLVDVVENLESLIRHVENLREYVIKECDGTKPTDEELGRASVSSRLEKYFTKRFEALNKAIDSCEPFLSAQAEDFSNRYLKYREEDPSNMDAVHRFRALWVKKKGEAKGEVYETLAR